ncbi:MAG: ribulose bisphosphate carboxylase small subunit [Chloroflexi bacterium]|nr:ribulose bisphosphate carboxylase small subunit [Chloroflexota bacterium]MBI5964522.1 ribulose bisphosphate carboxylase small subunit [Chloroflexota bacterium]
MKTETFSYLPTLTSEQIEKQIQYFLNQGWVVGIEHSSRLDPKLAFWDWWKLPLFNVRTVGEIMSEIEACKSKHGNSYIRITSYDNARQTQVMGFVVHRP